MNRSSYRVGSRRFAYGSRLRIAIPDRRRSMRRARASRRRETRAVDGDGRFHPSIHPSIHPSVRDARAAFDRARAFDRAPSEPRAFDRAPRATIKRRANAPNRRRAIDSIRFVRASSIDRERTIDRPSIRFVSATDGAISTRGTISARLDERAVVPRERRARTRARTREARARDVVQGHVARGAAGGAHAGAAVRKDAARGAGNEAKRFDRDD